MRAALMAASLTLFAATAPVAAQESLFLSILPPGQDGLVPASNPGGPRPHATDLGGFATAPAMPWQNRPTFQQVVQVR
jgi:hypothetical protein